MSTKIRLKKIKNYYMQQDENSAQDFLNLIKKSRRGKFKIYIGMSAGVGKTYRMLQEAHSLLASGIDVKIGYIETHQRKETHSLLDGLPIIPRRKLFYKGKELEELDVQAVINLRPEVVIFRSSHCSIIALVTLVFSTLIISAPNSVAILKLLMRCLCLSKGILSELSRGICT